MIRKNTHPVDELAVVRDEIKTLKQREDYIRERILSGDCDTVGRDYLAKVTTQQQKRLDSGALKRAFGAGLSRYQKTVCVTIVKLIRR